MSTRNDTHPVHTYLVWRIGSDPCEPDIIDDVIGPETACRCYLFRNPWILDPLNDVGAREIDVELAATPASGTGSVYRTRITVTLTASQLREAAQP